MAASTKARLKVLYENEVQKALKEELGIENVNQVPKIEKIVVSTGLGRGKDEKKLFDVAENTLRKITGQHPVETTAKKSIASFKLRQGMKIGYKVTLRGEKMYEFYDRLVNIVLPRVRDFHGVPLKAMDNAGNYSIGLKDQSVFPELSYEETSMIHGIEVTIVTSTDDKAHSEALLRALGMPFYKRKEKSDA